MKKITAITALLSLFFCVNAQTLTIKNGAILSVNNTNATPVLTVNGNINAAGAIFDIEIAGIDAGLKVVVDGNMVDGSLAGLLADRAAFEARLLRRLEEAE